jgi:hypothetical protein
METSRYKSQVILIRLAVKKVVSSFEWAIKPSKDIDLQGGEVVINK